MCPVDCIRIRRLRIGTVCHYTCTGYEVSGNALSHEFAEIWGEFRLFDITRHSVDPNYRLALHFVDTADGDLKFVFEYTEYLFTEETCR